MSELENKLLDFPDETHEFDFGRFDVVMLGGVRIGRAILDPGWRWSSSLKPSVGTDSCQQRHVGYLVSGHLKVVTDDGAEAEFVPGDAAVIPPGHDAWVVGDERVVFLEFAMVHESVR